MPQGQFKSVYAVSSEDPANPASNLLKIQSGKKWKTKEAGDKSAFVVLQFDKPQKITGIDIGNEHSAFAMVTVGKMGCSNDDYKEILITCSFMTPIESKNSTNTNRVRCFTSNALVESIAEEKWDLVKVICTQPFNRHVQYGLSFITVHVANNGEPSTSGITTTATKSSSLVPEKFLTQKVDSPLLGFLKLREDSPDSETENSSTLFNRWKESRSGTLSTAAAIRAASSPAALKNNSESLKPSKVEMSSSSSNRRDTCEEKNPIRDRNRDDLLFDKDDDVSNERLERRISQDQNRLQKEREAIKKQDRKFDQSFNKTNEDNVRKKDDVIPESSKKRDEPDSSKKCDEPGSSKKQSENSPASSKKRQSSSSSPTSVPAKKLKADKPIEYRPFNKLLQGVVLVISGIQNPDRAILRQQSIDLGARYKPDWDDNCTHLICAFKNTPKYNQVRGKGKIVTRQWIEKCHSLKKRLPWRRYALSDREADKPESEDEIHDLSLKAPDVSGSKSPLPEAKSKVVKLPSPPQQMEESVDDVIIQYDLNGAQNVVLSSGSDTEEEIEKVRMTLSDKIKTDEDSDSDRKTNVNLFEASTEEDESIKNPTGKEKKPQFFDGLKFYLSPSMPATELIKLRQYISQFKGKFVEKMDESDLVISRDAIEPKHEIKGEVVSPLWVFECYDMECRIPTRRYLV